MSKIRVDFLETLDGSKTVSVANIGTGGGGGPGGNAGGVLSGTYPNPGFAVPMATQSAVNAALLNKQDKLVPATTAEMQDGSSTAPRLMTPKNVSEAIQALAPGGGGGGGSPSGPAGGVLSGSYPNPNFAVPMATVVDLNSGLANKANASHTHPLSQIEKSGATSGQVPTWNGVAWVPMSPTGGAGPKPALGKLKNLANQSTITPSGGTAQVPLTSVGAVSLNGITIDPGNPPWIRVPRAGYYRINAGAMVKTNSTAGTVMFLRVYANTTALFDGNTAYFAGGVGYALRSVGSDIVYLQANDAVSMEVFTTAAATFIDADTFSSNWLTVEEVVNVL